jgi:hypothetical protein
MADTKKPPAAAQQKPANATATASKAPGGGASGAGAGASDHQGGLSGLFGIFAFVISIAGWVLPLVALIVPSQGSQTTGLMVLGPTSDFGPSGGIIPNPTGTVIYFGILGVLYFTSFKVHCTKVYFRLMFTEWSSRPSMHRCTCKCNIWYFFQALTYPCFHL